MFLENMHRRKVVKMIFMLENTNWNKTLSLKDAPPWILMNVGDIYAWYFSIEEFDDASAEQHGCIYRSSLNPTENSAGEFLKSAQTFIKLSYSVIGNSRVHSWCNNF